MSQEKSKSVIIIGAGIAGLAAGIFAQKNGYSSQVFEMHTSPGGLMTAWKRKGYTIDGCIHWLTGSGPKSNYYPLWRELGILQKDTRMVNPEIFSVYESGDGTKVNWYCDIDRFERHFIEIGPQDSKIIHAMCNTARKLVGYNPPIGGSGNAFQILFGNLKSIPMFISLLPAFQRWGKMNLGDFSKQFKTPALRELYGEMWMEDMSAVALIFIMAYLHDQIAGYPIGGSIPMAEGQEKRYLELGGQVHYNSRVEKILVEENRAVGIRLVDGSEFRADYVISGADGHATIFEMLDGRYVDDKIQKIYDNYKLFPPILMVGLGVNRTFADVPAAHGGISLTLAEPITIGKDKIKHLDCMIYNFDPTLAPEGKTVMTVTTTTDYAYWKELSGEPEKYKAEKDRIGIEVIKRMDTRFPGLAGQVEMADVATPMTFERYTGNWQGSFEGFLPTPASMSASIPKVLPGLENFYMVGQWVQAGGGLPSGLMTAQEVVIKMCKKDGKKFH